MSRLASLTPSRPSPRSSLSPPPSPASPARPSETTHHRMLKLLLAEVRSVIKQWDDLVSVDGRRAGKGCVDNATEMDNILQLQEAPERPPIGPLLEALYTNRAGLEAVMNKLDKLLFKMSLLIDQAEKIFFEAYRTQGWEFALTEPLWLTWTLERFVNSLAPLLSLHNHQYHRLALLARIIASSETSFDDAKLALENWQDLSRGGERWDGVQEWEELVELELAGSRQERENAGESGVKQRRKGRKG